MNLDKFHQTGPKVDGLELSVHSYPQKDAADTVMVHIQGVHFSQTVHLSLDQATALAESINSCLDWLVQLPAALEQAEAQARRDVAESMEDAMAEERATPRGEYDAQTVRVPAFMAGASM